MPKFLFMFLLLNIIYICALLGTNKAYTYFNGADCYTLFTNVTNFFVVSV